MSAGEAPRAARHWFLCGFSGSGKSTVGALVAAASGRVLLDLDEALARREGLAAAAFLAERGEEAFRIAELATLEAELAAAAGPLVVALGGGALERPAVLRRVEAAGVLAWLDVPLATCLARLRAGGGPRRPVLEATHAAGGDEAVARLHEERVRRYRRARVQVDATAEPETVAAAVLAALEALADGSPGAEGN